MQKNKFTVHSSQFTEKSQKTKTNSIYIIGVPSKIEEGLSKEALDVMSSSAKIFCAKRFFDVLKKDTALKPKLVQFPAKLSDLPALLKSFSASRLTSHTSRTFAVLATGDPDLFGITNCLKKHFPDNIVVIPAVSVMQEAFARLKMNWDDAGFFSLHGRNRDGLLAFLLTHHKGFCFTSDSADLLFILKTLKENRLEDFTVHIMENIGTATECVTRLSFPYLLKKTVSPLNVLIYERVQAAGLYPGIGLDESAYAAKRGMITKREVRANALSLLDLKEGSVMWDIGAGSGSLSIEASYNPAGTLVFAIEKDKESFYNLKKNIKQFSAVNVKPVFAEFMDVHKSLPAPDRVFIGGGGKDWQKNCIAAYSALKSGGVIVIAAVTLESLSATAQFFSDRKISFEISGITAVRTENIKGHTILKSRNPVFLIKAVKRT